MRKTLALALVATASAQIYCTTDQECLQNGAFGFCKTMSQNTRQCELYANQGQNCYHTNDLTDTNMKLCTPGLACAPGFNNFNNNPNALVGTCQPPVVNVNNGLTNGQCVFDTECGNAEFCQLQVQQGTTGTTQGSCQPRANLGQLCAVTSGQEIKCQPNLECRTSFDPSQAALGQGVCVVSGTGLQCQSNADCGSGSLFCKRVSESNPSRQCFTRGAQNDRCTWQGYVSEWDNQECLPTMRCLLIDQSSPGLGGTCKVSGSSCVYDRDCGGPNHFCRRTSASSYDKQCFERSGQGQACSVNDFTVEWAVQKCLDVMQCQEIDPNNPGLGGTCLAQRRTCIHDSECVMTEFCKRSSSTSDIKHCHARASLAAQCTSAGFVAEWNEQKCMIGAVCNLVSMNNPTLGGLCRDKGVCGNCGSIAAPVCANGREYLNRCSAACDGLSGAQIVEGPCDSQGCYSDDNCDSRSFFCKRAMINSNFKSCFLRSTEGQPCTVPGYVADWNDRRCLGDLFCVLNDQNAPGLGGTCQTQANGCEEDSDCQSSNDFCKRASSSNTFSACFPRSLASEECTIGTSVPEWNTKQCLNTLYCWPLNFNNPSAGGTCRDQQANNNNNNGQMYNQYNNGYNNNFNNNFNNGFNNNYNNGFNNLAYNQYYNNNNNNINNNNNGLVYNQYNNGYYNGYNNYNNNNQYYNNNNNNNNNINNINYNQYNNGYYNGYYNYNNYNQYYNNNNNNINNNNNGLVYNQYNNGYYNGYNNYNNQYNNQYNNGYYNGYNNYNQNPTIYDYNNMLRSTEDNATTTSTASTVYSSCSLGCHGEGAPAQNGQKCYCDSKCSLGGDCCPDYHQYCASWRSGSAAAAGSIQMMLSRPQPRIKFGGLQFIRG